MTTDQRAVDCLLHTALGYPEKMYYPGHTPNDVRGLLRAADSVLVLDGPGFGDDYSICQVALAQVGPDTRLARLAVPDIHAPSRESPRSDRTSASGLGRCCRDAVDLLTRRGFFALPEEVGVPAMDSPSITAFAWTRQVANQVTFWPTDLSAGQWRIYRRLRFLLHAPVWRLRLGQFLADRLRW
ncbi:MAG: hypothetical protein ACRC33_04670 [Gemmataceae bacterium]